MPQLRRLAYIRTFARFNFDPSSLVTAIVGIILAGGRSVRFGAKRRRLNLPERPC